MADDKPIAWRPLVEGLAHAEKFLLSRLVAESDLPRLLRAGVLPWRGERRGGRESDLDSGDPRVWGGESEDVDRPVVYLAPKWEENLLLRILHPGRAVLRSGVRLASRKIFFVRIEIDMGRLRELMPLDAPAETNPKTAREPSRKSRRGPTKGSRYEDSDRAHFPALRELMAKGKSVSAAARELGKDLAGEGAPDNKAKRLVKLFNKER